VSSLEGSNVGLPLVLRIARMLLEQNVFQVSRESKLVLGAMLTERDAHPEMSNAMVRDRGAIRFFILILFKAKPRSEVIELPKLGHVIG